MDGSGDAQPQPPAGISLTDLDDSIQDATIAASGADALLRECAVKSKNRMMRYIDSSAGSSRRGEKNPALVPPLGGCPINGLPNELLLQIFMVGAAIDKAEEDGWEDEEDEDDELELVVVSSDEEDGMDSSGGRDARDEGVFDGAFEGETQLPFQVLVSHICQRWRNLALDSPNLWTFLTFTEGPPFEKSRTWLERSKNLPLTIHIDTTPPEDSPEASSEEEEDEEERIPMPRYTKGDLTDIMSLISPHIARWRTFQLMVNLYQHMHLVLNILAAAPPAPLLEVLHLYHYEDLRDYSAFQPANLRDSEPPTPLFSNSAPRLSQVALWGVHLPWTESYGLLRGLTELELAYHAKDVRPPWAAFAHMLSSSPGLETLTLCLSGPKESNPEREDEVWLTTSISLPALTSLVLAFHHPEYISALVALLHTPDVTSLALDFEDGDYSMFAQQLASAIPVRGSLATTTRSRSLLAGLEHLKISGLPCDERSVDAVYRQLERLRSINLNFGFLDLVWFWKLSAPGATTAQPDAPAAAGTPAMYCPLLDTLTTTSLGGQYVRECVERRKVAGFPIKRVFMSEDDEISREDLEWLNENLETFQTFEPSDDEDVEEEEEEEDGNGGDGDGEAELYA